MRNSVSGRDLADSHFGEEKTPLDRVRPDEFTGVESVGFPEEERHANGLGTTTSWERCTHGTSHALAETKSAESSPIIPARTPRASSTGTPKGKKVYQGNEAREDGEFEHAPLPPRRRLRIYRAGNRTNKWVTREIAALEFLTGLRMRNEEVIRARVINGGNSEVLGVDDDACYGGSTGNNPKCSSSAQRVDSEATTNGVPVATPNGTAQAGNAKALVEGDLRLGSHNSDKQTAAVGANVPDDDSDSEGGWLDQPHPSERNGHRTTTGWRGLSSSRRSGVTGLPATTGRISGGSSPAPARRLRGREAAYVRVPGAFRHNMQNLPGHGSAVVRQWEQGLTRQERLLEGRIFFACSKSYPLMVSSVLHYNPGEEEARRVRQKWIDKRGAEAFLILKRLPYPASGQQELLDSLSQFPELIYFFSHDGCRPHSCTSTFHFFQSNQDRFLLHPRFCRKSVSVPILCVVATKISKISEIIGARLHTIVAATGFLGRYSTRRNFKGEFF